MGSLDMTASKRSADWRNWKKPELATRTTMFNLRCKDEDVTPASVIIKSLIPTRNVESIIERARKTLVRERIRTTMNKLEKINKQIKGEMDWFSKHYTLEKSIVEEVNVHLKHAYEQEFNKEKQRQTKKLNKLIERKNSDKLTSQSMKNGYETCQNAPSQKWKKQC